MIPGASRLSYDPIGGYDEEKTTSTPEPIRTAELGDSDEQFNQAKPFGRQNNDVVELGRSENDTVSLNNNG